MNTPNIGLTGVARAGKDTIGAILVSQFGYRRVGLADKVREFALAVDPLIGPWGQRLSELVQDRGWEGAKGHSEVRRLLQHIGTEGGRRVLHEDVWLEAAFDENRPYPIVVTDVRFQNEATWLMETMDALIIKVERAGYGPINDHASDNEEVNVDYVIYNNGSLSDLELGISEFFLWYGNEWRGA